MENLLRACKGVSVYLDDILITGSNDFEHLGNLDQVLKKFASTGIRLNQANVHLFCPR